MWILSRPLTDAVAFGSGGRSVLTAEGAGHGPASSTLTLTPKELVEFATAVS